MEDYFQYFSRVGEYFPDAKAQIDVQINSGDIKGDTLRLITLFTDCFGHHVIPSTVKRDDALKIAKGTDRRFISRDSLNLEFVDVHYRPPYIAEFPYEPDLNKEITQVDVDESFDQLLKTVQASPISNDPQHNARIGSNTFTYIVGDVGLGKSQLATYLLRKIAYKGQNDPFQVEDELGYVVFPVYLNVDNRLDWEAEPPPIDDTWFNKTISTIIDSLKEAKEFLSRARIELFDDLKDASYIERMQRLTQYLAKNKVRLLIILDNVDRYHFFYSRYRFSESYKNLQNESIKKNLRRLIDTFSLDCELGFCGLCIIYICRDYVFRHLRAGVADKSRRELEFGRAFELVLLNDFTVVESRIALLGKAINLLLQENKAPMGIEYLGALQNVMRLEKSGDKLRPEFELILKLSNHGYRSLIDFIASLDLDPKNIEVFNRLLLEQPKNLPSLYILDVKRRYSQKTKHFPNLFLVDGQISAEERFKDAYEKHNPTYWLKYFILKFVSRNPGIKSSRIFTIFHKIGEYEEKIVALALGSLCSTNDCRCIDIDPSDEADGLINVSLKATDRGMQLVTSSDAFSDSPVDFCFEFNYLQLVIDDVWLSIPLDWCDDIISKYHYGYLYEKDNRSYGEMAWNMVYKKSFSVLLFLSLMHASFRAEMKKRKPLHDYLIKQGLLPDFDLVTENIKRSCIGIFHRFEKEKSTKAIAEFEKLHDQIKADTKKMYEFFDNIYKLEVKVE